jgi:heat shock protein HslJ
MRLGTILLFVLAACSTQRPSDPAALQGMVWTSISAADEKPAASLRFEAGGAVEGTDGCNRLFGTAVVGTRIDLSKVASTRMACVHGRDSAFWAAFNRHDHWRIRGEELQLLQGKKVIWRFEGQAPANDTVEERDEEKQ